MALSRDDGERSAARADAGALGILGRVEGGALARGIGAALAVVVPAAGLAILVSGEDGSAGAVSTLLILVTLAGFGFGGWTASRASSSLPATQGALTGLSAFALVQLALLAWSASAGEDLSELSGSRLAFSAIVASLSGMLGAKLARRRRG